MSTYNGRNGRVTVNANTTEAVIAELSNWSISMDSQTIDTSVFGDEWAKSDIGQKSWSGSATGFFDPEDTTGQDILETAWKNGTVVSDIRFYSQYTTTSGEKLIYHKPDTASDANAGLWMTSMQVGQEKNGVGSITFSFQGTGPVTQVTSTVA